MIEQLRGLIPTQRPSLVTNHTALGNSKAHFHHKVEMVADQLEQRQPGADQQLALRVVHNEIERSQRSHVDETVGRRMARPADQFTTEGQSVQVVVGAIDRRGATESGHPRWFVAQAGFPSENGQLAGGGVPFDEHHVESDEDVEEFGEVRRRGWRFAQNHHAIGRNEIGEIPSDTQLVEVARRDQGQTGRRAGWAELASVDPVLRGCGENENGQVEAGQLIAQTEQRREGGGVADQDEQFGAKVLDGQLEEEHELGSSDENHSVASSYDGSAGNGVIWREATCLALYILHWSVPLWAPEM